MKNRHLIVKKKLNAEKLKEEAEKMINKQNNCDYKLPLR